MSSDDDLVAGDPATLDKTSQPLIRIVTLPDPMIRAEVYGHHIRNKNTSSWFIKYVKSTILRRKSQCYANCAFLEHPSGMDKYKFLHTRMETKNSAVFQIYINCGSWDYPFYDEASYNFVQRLLNARTFLQVSLALYKMLALVFSYTATPLTDGADNDDGIVFFLKTDPGSYSLGKIGIENDDLEMAAFKDCPLHQLVKLMTERLYWRKDGVQKKVYPVIAFDNAACLETNTFQLIYEFFDDNGIQSMRFLNLQTERGVHLKC